MHTACDIEKAYAYSARVVGHLARNAGADPAPGASASSYSLTEEECEDIRSEAWMKLVRSNLFRQHCERKAQIARGIALTIPLGRKGTAWNHPGQTGVRNGSNLTFTDPEEFAAWSLGMLTRQFVWWSWVQFWRGVQKRQRLMEMDLSCAVRATLVCCPDPEAFVLADESRQEAGAAVERALAGLTDFERAVYDLTCINGFSQRIARETLQCGMPRIHAACRTIEAALRQHGLTPPEDILERSRDQAYQGFVQTCLVGKEKEVE